MNRPNILDWIIYRIFVKRWNPIFRENKEMWIYYLDYMGRWNEKFNEKEKP